ncbi:DUF1707 domain-containing protein [Aeromicrobium sp. UC242_57]|uniref:DUF1707 domain-containing protein n=1 Tax=Aeromicrobium sp. UC242_57 TaxID=3374624 RepID=UPI0037921BB7
MSQRKVRARDVDRDVAIEIVEAAWADGQLTRDEYEQRVDRLLQASTLADLERDILDLQPEGVVWRPRPSSATTTPAPPVRHEPTTPSTKLSVLTGLVLAGVGVAALAFVVRPGSASSPDAPTPQPAKTSASLLTPEAFNLAREALDEHSGSDTVYTAMLTSEALSVIRPTTAAGTDAVKTTWDGEWGADEPVTATENV